MYYFGNPFHTSYDILKDKNVFDFAIKNRCGNM